MTTFADPPPAAPPAPAFTDPPKNKDYVVRGRYRLPDPDTGEDRTWTRVTNMDVISDKYNVQEWEKRMVVKGMALDPALVAQASILDVTRDKDPLNKLAWRAKEKAGGSSGAGMGTALHTVTERYDRGEDVDAGVFGRELAAYRATLAAEGLSMDPHYLERIICVPELGCAGRLDKLMRLPDSLGAEWSHQVGDLKSQKSMEFGGLGMAIQLSIYAHAYAVWNEDAETWEDPPAIDQVLATVIWLPVGVGECELYDVDLVYGWRWAKVAHEIREGRKHKPVTRRESMVPAPSLMPDDAAPSSRPNLDGDPRDLFPAIAAARLEVPHTTMYADIGAWELVFRAAKSLEELTRDGRNAAADFGGRLPDALKALGAELRAALEAPSQEDVLESLWEGAFRRAKTLEELNTAAQEALADLGGTLPDALKDLGRELRDNLPTT